MAFDRAGNVYTTDAALDRVTKFAPDGTFIMQWGQIGLEHGQFRTPHSMAFDSQGRLWVADYFNNRVLRYDNPSTKGNGGGADGVLGQPNFTSGNPGASATGLKSPYDVALDAQGRLWVADFDNARVLRFDSPASQIQPAANGVLGQPDFTTISTGAGPAKTNRAITLALSPSGSLFVVDCLNSRILRWDNAAAKSNG